MNVLVVFQSRLGSTERLALAAAVGAVQGRANIRLRWLADDADEARIAASPEWHENRVRMAREYVAPRPGDAEWAEAILAGLPDEFNALSPEFGRYINSLREHAGLTAKVAAVFTSNTAPLEEAFKRLGLRVVPFAEMADSREAALQQGRRAADAIRSQT